jgi:hypothetical protein
MAEERKLEEASQRSKWVRGNSRNKWTRASKCEDSRRLIKIDQAPGRQRRGRTEKNAETGQSEGTNILIF